MYYILVNLLMFDLLYIGSPKGVAQLAGNHAS
jgi:hypothetical protein